MSLWQRLRSGLEQQLPQVWARKGMAARLLWPLSQIYRLLAALDQRRQRQEAATQAALGVPVWVVGNAYVGGTGKTPITLGLVQWLQSQGHRPGVVSRGYGRHSQSLQAVSRDTPAQQVGDEPWLIHHKTGVPVFVGTDRRRCAQALCEAHPQVSIIVSDDGLQHHRLASDLRICVWDDRGLGNGWLLPAGPLRQAWPVQADVHVLSVNLVRSTWHPSVQHTLQARCHIVQRRLSAHAVNAAGQRRALRSFADAPVYAVAGIARPQVFFDMLADQGLPLAQTFAAGDHADLGPLPPGFAQGPVLCTEKDAAKLWQQGIEAWAVGLELQWPDALWQRLLGQLPTVPGHDSTLSSRHGHKTA